MSRGKHWQEKVTYSVDRTVRTLTNDHREISIRESRNACSNMVSKYAVIEIDYGPMRKRQVFTPQDFGMSRRISIYNPKFTAFLKRKAFYSLMKLKISAALSPKRKAVA